MGWKRHPKNTGVRDITGLSTGVTSGTVLVYRVGHMVTLILDQVGLEGTGWTRLVSLPSGFRPPATVRESVPNDHGTIGVYSSGSVYTHYGPEARLHTLTYGTFEAWPSSLPGSEVA